MPTSDFRIENLARYLHSSPQQVARLADRGKIPGRKVAGEWRFSRADIHHWLEERIGVSDEGELLSVEGILRRACGGESPEEISVGGALPLDAIALPLPAKTRNSVFTSMVDLALATGLLWDGPRMVEAVRSREDLYPTAMENGAALLHPRRPMPSILGEALLALGITASGIPFGSSDGKLTDVFLLICSVDDRGHLRMLARLSRILGTPGFLDALRQCHNSAAAHHLVAETEANLPR
jgi:PTS system nitrogen regulatory IIA component